ncbi:MAG: methyltransferase domain-containing protein [Proteobacteria bacterium]|nr:methyltransferase domain-containing protein [Pseudomonadota bacterium]
MARIFGIAAAAPDGCSVLELGCGSGGHLFSMARQLPQTRFVGLDLSEVEIGRARSRCKVLGLQNVELIHASITDIDPELGEFDYVIAHGIYSWVPDEVRQAVLVTCRRHLARDGVAYVSYNTFPGWYLRGMVRDMMLYHVEEVDDPMAQIAGSRELLTLLGQALPEENLYGALLRNEMDHLVGQPDDYVYHDQLSPDNKAFWFRDFVAAAEEHQLQYLAETVFSTMVGPNVPPAVMARLPSGSRIRTAQYLDFINHRAFRHTLLVHEHHELESHLDWRIWQDKWVAAYLKAPDGADLSDGVAIPFEDRDGRKMSTSNTLMNAVFLELCHHPQGLEFVELVVRAKARMGEPLEDGDIAEAGAGLLAALAYDRVEPLLAPYRFVLQAGELPLASHHARLAAQLKDACMPTLRHDQVTLDEFDRRLLMLMDGTRTRSQLVEELIGIVKRKELEIEVDGEHIADAEQLRSLFTAALKMKLWAYGRDALLEA